MGLIERFGSEKEAVARFIVGIWEDRGEVTAQVAGRLDIVLGDQVHYDHRGFENAEIRNAWAASKSISELVKSENGFRSTLDLAGLANSTYAFRMLVLSHVLVRIDSGAGRRIRYEAVLSDLGHGRKEVEAYVADFLPS